MVHQGVSATYCVCVFVCVWVGSGGAKGIKFITLEQHDPPLPSTGPRFAKRPTCNEITHEMEGDKLHVFTSATCDWFKPPPVLTSQILCANQSRMQWGAFFHFISILINCCIYMNENERGSEKACPIICKGKENELVKQRTRVMNPVHKWVTDCWEYVKLVIIIIKTSLRRFCSHH